MFNSLIRKASRRASRRMAKQATGILKATAKATQTALRQSSKTLQRASKAAGQTHKPAKALVPLVHRPPGRFIEVEGVRVHYIARGKGRPAVLIHGNGTMAEDFAISGLIDQLATRYRVIAIDRPGFGHTERPRSRIWTASAQAQLLHRVLERLRVQRPVVVGHSWGTLVALALAVGNWRELRGLVLLSGYYYPKVRADVAFAAPLAMPIFGDVARSVVPQAAGHLLAPHVFRQVFWPKPVPAYFKARFPLEITLATSPQRASAEDTATLNAAAASLQSSYPRLNVPLALLTGDMDAIVSARDHSYRLHQEAPESTLFVLTGHGHMIQYSAAAEIGRAVDGLMGSTGSSRSGMTSWKSRNATAVDRPSSPARSPSKTSMP